MYFFMRFVILVWICANASGNDASSDDLMPTNAPTVIQPKADEMAAPVENKVRDKRQWYVPTTTPILFDRPQQPGGGLLGLGNTAANIPIVGTFVSGLPFLGNGQNLLGGLSGTLNGLTSSLGLGNVGGLLGTAPSVTNAASCPASQTLACRCEPSIQTIKPLSTRKDANFIEILDQRVKRNVDGSTEIIAELTNGLILYQKSSNLQLKEVEGYYSLKVAENRYLTIYYTINDADYTVKADVNSEPPRSNIEVVNEHQNSY